MSFINKLIVFIVRLMPKSWVWTFSKKYIAGENLEDAVRLVQSLNEKGIYATIDVLGEAIKNKDEAIADKEKALEVLDSIVKNNLQANLSIKPTQMGLGIDEDFAFHQVSELAKKAREINNFIRIDMEDSPYTSSTIKLYKRLREKYDNFGIVIQSYLKRSHDDILSLNRFNANYRLCKGIYVEPAEIAYKDKQEIRDNFLKLLEEIFRNGSYVGIATHDEYLIKRAIELINKMEIPKNKFEFQMLLGVREDLRDRINSDGYKIRIYVPFGKDWYKYSVRRLKENPQIALQITKNIFGIK